jgi:UDP-N-acetylmuramoyl-L-alanyl-D-glutamate--2,6-diaminopimelate ligase
MRLSNLLQNVNHDREWADCNISSLALDSRKIKPGGLFLAIKGAQLDGRCYIQDAISRGAAAVLVDALSTDEPLRWQENVPLIPVDQLQAQIGQIAAKFYDEPAKQGYMVGVTGTSGKTSCTHFIAEALQLLQQHCGLIGTLGCGFYGALDSVGLTTPDAITLQSQLHQLVTQGASAIAMEVSSHSIAQSRIGGIEFDVGVFTNLTQDHLDYHGDMASYAAVKRTFLASADTRALVINADDAYGLQWIQELSPNKPIIAYTTSQTLAIPSHIPVISASHIELSLKGISAYIHSPWGEGELWLPLIGKFNLSNCLAALAVLTRHGVPFKDMLHAFSMIHPVVGRMQTLSMPKKPLVVVDYAHKPDALEQVLLTLRQYTQGQLYCVFGCGGERDRLKRPLMASIAERLADQVIVTNDNPRRESPADIVADIMAGFTQPDRVTVEFDRSKAIENSIQWAHENDCILIAGKGAEHYQQIGDERMPFDDIKKAQEILDVTMVK